MAFTLHHPTINDREWKAMSTSQQSRANLAQVIEPHEICTEPDLCQCGCEVCKNARIELTTIRENWGK